MQNCIQWTDMQNCIKQIQNNIFTCTQTLIDDTLVSFHSHVIFKQTVAFQKGNNFLHIFFRSAYFEHHFGQGIVLNLRDTKINKAESLSLRTLKCICQGKFLCQVHSEAKETESGSLEQRNFIARSCQETGGLCPQNILNSLDQNCKMFLKAR